MSDEPPAAEPEFAEKWLALIIRWQKLTSSWSRQPQKRAVTSKQLPFESLTRQHHRHHPTRYEGIESVNWAIIRTMATTNIAKEPQRPM
jgi:hypothetical protein